MDSDRIRLSVPYGLIFVGDPSAPPELLDGRRSAANEFVVSIATLHEVDGDVLLRLSQGDQADERLAVCAFNGELRLPGGKVCVSSTDDVLLETAAPMLFAKVTVWTNHPTDPTDVLVAVGESGTAASSL